MINDIKKELPKACPSSVDQDTYATFFNVQCTGYPGFPMNFTADFEANDAAANRARLGLWAVPVFAAGAALL